MNVKARRLSQPRILGKTLGVTVLAFLLSYVFMSPLSGSTAAFFSTPEKNDFTITDFYNIVADSRAISYLDTNIVIVNIDKSDRNDIAEMLEIISLCGPKAIGVDVMFSEPREGDEVLFDALNDCQAVVLPIGMKPTDSSESFRVYVSPFFYNPDSQDSLKLATAEYAATSMPSKYAGSMVREMRPFFVVSSGDTILSFATALARIADPESYEELRNRRHKLESICFHSRRFRIIEPEELMTYADELTGKIVILGALNEMEDLHPTPVDGAMPGVLIHAHSTATILDRAYMTTLPKWFNILLGFIACFSIVYTHIVLNPGIKGLVIRLLQVALLWIVVQLGYWLFINYDILIDFSYALLMLAFGLFACDIWTGVHTVIKNIISHRQKKRGII